MKVYELIADRIMDLLKQGIIPWKKPWHAVGFPRNLVSNKDYRGVNLFILSSTGFTQPYWLTFNQAKELGGSVKRGEKGIPVVFWKILKKEEENSQKEVNIPFLRYYTVFNVEQCENLKKEPPKIEKQPFEPIELCEKVISDWKEKPEIRHKELSAFYTPKEDFINMPKKEFFKGNPFYYSTLFHEFVHSTGHPKRLNRKGISEIGAFGSAVYSKEELVAEMGSSFLSGHCGIDNSVLLNNAAYIASWLKALDSDRAMVVFAASQAQKAVDYILGRKADQETSQEST
jgi:antirestriction protein ArdC